MEPPASASLEIQRWTGSLEFTANDSWILAQEFIADVSNCIVVPFGSICSGLGTNDSDLDLAIFTKGNNNEFELLKNIRKKIKYATGDFLQLIPAKRVPILHGNLALRKGTARYSVIVDISVGSDSTRHCVLRDILIKSYVQANQMFRTIYLAFKEILKVNSIPDSKAGGVNSVSIALICIYSLQNLKIPALPVLQKDKDYFDWSSTEVYLKWGRTWEERTQNFQSANQGSVCELLCMLLEFVSTTEWSKHVLSIRKKSLMERPKSKDSKFDEEKFCMAIEDPIDPSHNVSMSLQPQTLQDIITLCRTSALHLRNGKSFAQLISANQNNNPRLETPGRTKRKSLDPSSTPSKRKTPRR
jgi:DNA polymerase sigma